MKIVLIRHASTRDNESGRIPDSRSGPSLSRRGRRAAKLLAPSVDKYMQSNPGTSVISSPSRRATETVRVLVGRRPFSTDERISEIDIGAPGTSDPNLIGAVDDLVRKWTLGEELERSFPGGESGLAVRARLLKVEESLNRAGVSTALLVTHFAIMRMWASLGRAQAPQGAPALLQAWTLELTPRHRRLSFRDPFLLFD